MYGAVRATVLPGAATAAQGVHSMPSVPINPPDPEVPEKAARRRFTAKYKLNILQQAEACRGEEGVGALLRREGLYSSHLTTWRRQREIGLLSALSPKRRGRKASARNPLQPEVDRLRKETDRLQKRLKQAELIIEIQKKISQMLGIPLETSEKGEGG
jgi:transposase-like protein